MTERLDSLDGNLLLAFDALLRDRNITRAARRLGIGQPAMSARLSRLRDVFGDRLFVPAATGRGVVPTPHAMTLEGRLSAALDGLRRLIEADRGFDPITSDRTFTIAMHDNPAMMLAPALIGRVHALAPMVRLVVVMPDARTVADDLEAGRIDLFVGRPESAQPQWVGRALITERFVTAQRKDHPLGHGPIDLDAFCARDHLLISAQGRGLSGIVDELLANAGRQRRVAASIQSYALAPLVIERSDLICTLPQRLLTRFADTLDLFQPPLELAAFDLSLFWHPRSHDDGGHSWLRGHLVDTAQAATA